MDTQKIYEQWAQEKYPNELEKGYWLIDRTEERIAYTAALQDKLEPVAVAWGKWFADEDKVVYSRSENKYFLMSEKEDKYYTESELFTHFLNNIYNAK